MPVRREQSGIGQRRHALLRGGHVALGSSLLRE
jgi:hypothetical protein